MFVASPTCDRRWAEIRRMRCCRCAGIRRRCSSSSTADPSDSDRWRRRKAGGRVPPMQSSPPRLSLAERLYLPEIVRGIGITAGHFVRNLTLHTLHLFGVAKDQRASVTVQYPEERKVYSDGFRGSH